MAKGNPFLGTASGKLGDTVLYRAGGQQRSRVKVTPKNPKSAKQAVQRMVLATAAKMASAYEPIVNHSWQGVTEGTKSVQFFRSRAMNLLRATAAVYLNDESATPAAADFAIKGSPCIGALDGLQISQGRLGMNGFAVESGDNLSIVLSSAFDTNNFSTQAAYEAELKKLGLVPGDQLTFVVQSRNISEVIASAKIGDVTEKDFSQQVQFCRVTFKSKLPENFSGTMLVDYNFNPALVEETFGALPAFDIDTVASNPVLICSFSSILDAGYDIQTAGVIRSQLSDGSWKYSSCYMKCNATDFDENDAYPTYYTYMDGVAEINIGSKLYLQHAVASPFGVGE